MVEDEPELSEILLRMIDSFGLEGQHAKSARTALEKIREFRFDVLLIDLTLPDKPGIQLYREIQEKNPVYLGKVIFTSGFEKSDELEQIIEQDNQYFLPKPFDLEDLREILAELTGSKALANRS